MGERLFHPSSFLPNITQKDLPVTRGALTFICFFEDLFTLQAFLLKRNYCQKNKIRLENDDIGNEKDY